MTGPPFNQNKVCEAIVRYLEDREGAQRSDVWSPEAAKHAAPVELVLSLNDQIFAIEHTGIEPFVGQIKSSVDTKSFFRPIKEKLSGVVPTSEQYDIYVPEYAMRDLRNRDIPAIQNALFDWIASIGPTLPLSQLGRLETTQKDVSVPGVPFVVSLYRYRRVTEPLSVVHSVHGVEAARRARIEVACKKKSSKLAAWKRICNARTILVLENIDSQLTNPILVSDDVAKIAATWEDGPDEIYMVTTWSDPWWVSPLFVDGKSIPEIRPGPFDQAIDPRSIE